ncbi:PDR/VanB family oxidoreductase [Rhodoligotrophos defluvii]|uniref:PDR/VanB family oxidoreductase n=1 Tax=Rhodoligotrophos defluvii TaxID=2561934 RepID=UPI0010C9804D|nr:PDR/VanB family oxidoreductase [Rhodoligotrophos defluvii]
METRAELAFDTVTVEAQQLGQDIKHCVFRRLDGLPFPDAEPGAHIDLELPNGVIRQYSLICPATSPEYYSIAVKRDPRSRGGSAFIHDHLTAGTELRLRGPRNTFPLVEDAAHSILIAGGIGVTPIWSMLQCLARTGRSWEFHYSCRNRPSAIFLDEARALGPVNLHVDEEAGGAVLDLSAILAPPDELVHVYCCGPAPMLERFESLTASWPSEQVHLERFTPHQRPATGGGYRVVLARSGRSFHIPAGATILQVLRDAGIEVTYSCEEGICGSCETRVIGGQPDHRDSVLSAAERQQGDTIMICCSGCTGEELILDL